MRSFAFAIEPRPDPRLASIALAAHACAAGCPWIAHVPVLAAAVLSLLALLGFAATLARIPGPHCRLAAVVWDSTGCRARLAGSQTFVPAEPGAGSRAMAWLVSLELRVGTQRLGWLLPRGSLPDAAFRRLRARIRLMRA